MYRLASLQKEIVGVEERVAQELKGGTVELVGTRLGDHVNVRTGVTAVASVIRGGENLKFLNGVGRRDGERAIEARFRGSSKACEAVDLDAVHLIVIRLRAGAVDGHVLRALA